MALAVPEARIVIAEPEGWDDMTQSLAGGAIVEVDAHAPSTACDALQTRRVANITFGALQEAGAIGIAVSEAEVRAAMRYAFGLGLVVEPGGAVALAAWLAAKLCPVEGDTVIVCSGRNVDPTMFAAVMKGER
jgi:threonine dehydratase